jgi:O-antigen ligase
MSDLLEKNTADIQPAIYAPAIYGPTIYGAAIVIMLCVLAILSVIAYGAVDTWATALMALGCMIIVWLWMADAWKLGAFTFSANPIQLGLLGLILIGVIQLLPLRGLDLSALLSVSPSQTLTFDANATRLAVTRLVIYLVFFAAALNFINSRKRYRRVIYTVIIFGALIAMFAIFQRLVNPENIYGAREAVQASIFGPYVNGHHFAALMEMTLGLSLGLFYGKTVRKELRIIFLVAAVLMGAAIIMTGSRGGLLSFIAVLGTVTIFALTNGRKKSADSNSSDKQRKLLIIGGAFAFVVLMAGIGLILGGDKAVRGFGVDGVGSDFSTGRLHFWSIALQIFRDNFLLGGGLDSFGVAFTKYDTWNGAFRIEYAHNDYLQTLADSGVAGFICVAGFIYLLFRQGVKMISSAGDRFHRSAATGALAGCFGILLHSFFDFPLRTPANALVFLILAALAIVSLRPAKQ